MAALVAPSYNVELYQDRIKLLQCQNMRKLAGGVKVSAEIDVTNLVTLAET